MIPHTLVLKPGLVVHGSYSGYWFCGRPSFCDLWHDLRAGARHAGPATRWPPCDPRRDEGSDHAGLRPARD